MENRPGLRSARLADGTILTIQRHLLDTQAAGLYLLLKHDELLPYYFHEGVPSLTDFMKMAVSPANIFYGCFLGREDSETVDLVGLVSGTNYTKGSGHGRADACMIFCKSVHRHNSEMALEFVELVLDDAFEDKDLNFAALYACIPSANLASIRFMKRIGFKQYGVCPLLCTWEGHPCDAVMAALTREDWYGRKTAAAQAHEFAENGASR